MSLFWTGPSTPHHLHWACQAPGPQQSLKHKGHAFFLPRQTRRTQFRDSNSQLSGHQTQPMSTKLSVVIASFLGLTNAETTPSWLVATCKGHALSQGHRPLFHLVSQVKRPHRHRDWLARRSRLSLWDVCSGKCVNDSVLQNIFFFLSMLIATPHSAVCLGVWASKGKLQMGSNLHLIKLSFQLQGMKSKAGTFSRHGKTAVSTARWFCHLSSVCGRLNARGYSKGRSMMAVAHKQLAEDEVCFVPVWIVKYKLNYALMPTLTVILSEMHIYVVITLLVWNITQRSIEWHDESFVDYFSQTVAIFNSLKEEIYFFFFCPFIAMFNILESPTCYIQQQLFSHQPLFFSFLKITR